MQARIHIALTRILIVATVLAAAGLALSMERRAVQMGAPLSPGHALNSRPSSQSLDRAPVAQPVRLQTVAQERTVR